MKKLLMAAAATAFASGSVLAADLSPLRKAPGVALASADTWSGLYIGAHAGGSFSDHDVGFSNPFAVPGNAFTFRDGEDGHSFLGGLQIGYNWQSGNLVFGLEGDASYRKQENNTSLVFGTNPTLPGLGAQPFGSVATDTAYFNSEQNWLGTIRGRLGYSGGAWMVYGTGGLAIGGVSHSYTEVLAPGTLPSAASRTVSDDKTKVGWTVGAGLELALGGSWSVAAEYLYVDLGKTTLSFPQQTIGVIFPASQTEFHDRSHIARVKLDLPGFSGEAFTL